MGIEAVSSIPTAQIRILRSDYQTPSPTTGISASSAAAAVADGMDNTSSYLSLDKDFDEGGSPSSSLTNARKRKRGGTGGASTSRHRIMYHDTIEKTEPDRMIREEAWKCQEMDRLTLEHEMMAQGRAISASRHDSVVAFTGHATQLPSPIVNPAAPPLQPQSIPPPAEPAPPSPQPKQNQLHQIVQHQPQKQQPPQSNEVIITNHHQPTSTDHVTIAVPEQQHSPAQDIGSGGYDPALSRWHKTEVLALVKLRSGLDSRFREAGPKKGRPLWEEISAEMVRMGYIRSAMKCQEKHNKYCRRFKKMGSGGSDTVSSRWQETEVLALIQFRSGLDSRFQEVGTVESMGGWPLWGEISADMGGMGYSRSAKKCKEKWDNINNYFKRLKERSKKQLEDAEPCPYFSQLYATYWKIFHDRSNRTYQESPIAHNIDSASSRWQETEVLALIQLRSGYQAAGKRGWGAIWAEISAEMGRMGFNKSGRQCQLKYYKYCNRITKMGSGGFDSASSRWQDTEVLALIQLRSGLDSRYQEAGKRGWGAIWAEISAEMGRMGYSYSAKKCSKKWASINHYFRRVKGTKDAETYPYFHQLDALHRKKVHAGSNQTYQESPIDHNQSSNTSSSSADPYRKSTTLEEIMSPCQSANTNIKRSSSGGRNITAASVAKKREDFVKDFVKELMQQIPHPKTLGYYGKPMGEDNNNIEDDEEMDDF